METLGIWARANGLTIHPTKTRIVDAEYRGGFDFLEYHFERGMKWPRDKSVMELRDVVRATTPRTSGLSIQQIIWNVNQVLRGWFEYFKHSKATAFKWMDGGCECVCEAFCGGVPDEGDAVAGRTINAGPTPALRGLGTSR